MMGCDVAWWCALAWRLGGRCADGATCRRRDSPSSRRRRRAARAGRPRPGGCRARSSHSACGACEVFVDELHGHRSFADGGGATFGGSAADVAGGEDTGHACLEQVVGAGCVPGEDEAVGGACDRVVEPFGARLCAEEEEEEGEWESLVVLERDLFELALRSVEGGDLAAVANGNAVALEVADQVIRHRLVQVGATVEQRHERSSAGEPDGGLSGGVAAANDGDTRGAAQLRLRRP